MKPGIEILNRFDVSGISYQETDFSKFGYDVKVGLTPENVRIFASEMLEAGYYLVYLSAFHVSPALQVIYEMANFESRFRIYASLGVPESGIVPTVADIYSGAAWHEREVRDFFGIMFENNTDMRPLILMETDQDFHPLLKKNEQLKSIESVTWQPEPEKPKAETPAS